MSTNSISKSQPLVSVVIPSFNHEQFIQQSIESIIHQDYKNLELIVIDDGSKDTSITRIQELIPTCQDRFVRFEFRHRQNKGLSATLNEGINWCTGDMISFCSSDDKFHFAKVSTQVQFLVNHGHLPFCFTKTIVIDDNGNTLERSTNINNKGLNNKITFHDIFTFKKNIPVTGMYDANFLKNKLHGFDESLSAEDYDMYLKILKLTNIGFIDQYLYYYRWPAALGGNRKRMIMRVDVSESHLRTINKYRGDPYYQQALLEWNFRRLIYFSRYAKSKLYALSGMLNSLKKINDLLWWKAVIRLIFLWD